jgi:transposase
LAQRLVVGRKRDGRSIYDEKAKHELVVACHEPGVSLAKVARACSVNANQLASWVRQYERSVAQSTPPDGEIVERPRYRPSCRCASRPPNRRPPPSPW